MKLIVALTLSFSVLSAAAIAEADSYLLLYSGVTIAERGDYGADVSITYGFNEQSWLSFSAAHAPAADDEDFALATSGYDLSFGHEFDKLGFSLGVAWWGDRGELESLTYSGAAYFNLDKWRFTLHAKQRDWEFTPGDLEALLDELDAAIEQALREQFGERFPNADFDDLLTLELDLDTEVTGYGVGIDYTPNDRLSFNLTHMQYDFSRDPDQSELTAELRRVTRTDAGRNLLARINQRLAVAFDGLGTEYKNGLYDFTTSFSTDINVGENSLAFTYTQDKDAIDGSYLRSFSTDWIHALGAQFDLRFTLGASDTQARDLTAFGGIGIYYYH
ncbi:MAG: hypothetical protein ACR2PS_01080 [Pseudomonadales bacterium]